jgi:hypothetical protein
MNEADRLQSELDFYKSRCDWLSSLLCDIKEKHAWVLRGHDGGGDFELCAICGKTRQVTFTMVLMRRLRIWLS